MTENEFFMSKKDNSPAISFFSFQDIITSITGIMFLVVMMLVLMILQQPSSTAKQVKKQVTENVKKLEKEIRELKKDLAELARLDEKRKKRLAELEKLNMEKLPAIKKELVSKLEAADALLLQMDGDEKEFLLKTDKAAKEKEKFLVDLEELNKKNKQDTVQINDLKDMLLKQKKLIAKYKNVMQFVWDKSNPKRPLLVECSKKSMILSSLDGKVNRKEFQSYAQCMQYCKSFSPSDTYFILLIKPSAFSYAETFSYELQKNGFERGREVVPDEDSVIIFGQEKGE